ncbi:MAG: tRNA lysidine(34) synthetase TilS [Gemmataceae bacterium]
MSRLVQVVTAWRQAHPGGLLLAVSGGPDSVALLRALAPLGEVQVAHLNHRLRGADSDADEAFVRNLCETWTIPCHTHALDIAALAEGDNLEAVARRERYAWLAALAQALQLPMVATGHTASDQAETVLHRLLRGTGLEGLRGIATARPLAEGVTLVRPLLSVSRGEVLEYLAQIGQSARHDASNDDLSLTRNRLRQLLLPLLARDYNPRIEQILCRLARQAEELFADEQSAAAELLSRAERPSTRADEIQLDSVTLAAAPGHQLRAALRLLWRRQGWPLAAMDATHWYALEAVCRGQATARDLPGSLRVRYAGFFVRLGPYGS